MVSDEASLTTLARKWNGPSYWSPVFGLAERCGGRLVSLLLKYDNCKINLVNVYAPTNPTERGIFFESLVPFFFPNSQLILVGDFNCYDESLDKM